MKKKNYIKPEIEKILLDNTISLQMQSPVKDPTPLGVGNNSPGNDPFASPFRDKPFN